MEGDLGVNWKRFKSSYELYMVATGGKEKEKAVQAAVLLHTTGEQAFHVFESLNLSKEDKKDPNKIIEKLDAHFLPKSNPSVETHKFNSKCQLQNETF